MRRVLIAAVVLAVTACGGEPSGHHGRPYDGLQGRDIAALSPERVSDLLAGEGAGYALAAELNHYPGPRHVLELASELGLSEDQAAEIQAIREEMRLEAVVLGRRLVDLERELDRAFASGTVTPGRLGELTQAIGEIEARLRSTHLAAHLATRDLLSDHQVQRYDELRGYEEGGNHPGEHG